MNACCSLNFLNLLSLGNYQDENKRVTLSDNQHIVFEMQLQVALKKWRKGMKSLAKEILFHENPFFCTNEREEKYNKPADEI